MKMMQKMFLVAASISLLASVAMAEVMYQNDLGTAAQFNGFNWVSGYGSGVGGLVLDAPGSGVVDLDGDGQHRASRMAAGFGSVSGIKLINAPAFSTMSNIKTSGYASSWAGYGAGVGYDLSKDGGVSWSYGAWMYAAPDNSMYYNEYSWAGNPDYTKTNQATSRVWIQNSSGTYDPSYAARSAAYKVEADVEMGEVGDIVNLSLNDFGTATQISEWMITGSNLQVVADSTQDRDMDDLGGRLTSDAAGACSAVLKIDAPAGYAFANPSAVGDGYGSLDNWGSSTQLQFSADGVNWDVSSVIPGAANGWYGMVADGTGVAGYDNLSTVYLRVYMQSSTDLDYLPQAKNLTMTAEIVAVPEPATMVLFGLGGLALYRKRR